MRNIKKYMTEDAFAQAENNSGYPYDSMTTARPGMAYVKENRNVYFNASPLPPPPELKYYYYFSGVTEEYYDLSNSEWVLNRRFASTFVFPSTGEPINEFYEIYMADLGGTGFSVDDEIIHWPLENSVTINVNDYLGMFRGETKDEYLSVSKMYTLGETTSYTSDSYTEYLQIFYETGDTNNTKYYVYLSGESQSYGSKSVDSNWWYLYTLTGQTLTGWNDLEEVGKMLKIESNWPTEFQYLPTLRVLYKGYYDGEIDEPYEYWDTYYDARVSGLIKLEELDDEHYKILSMNFEDVSEYNFTIGLNEYWGYVNPNDAVSLSVNPSLSTENVGDNGMVLGAKSSMGSRRKTSKRNSERKPGPTFNDFFKTTSTKKGGEAESGPQLVKFVTDDVVRDYTYTQNNTNYALKYKIFYTEDDTNHSDPLYGFVAYSYLNTGYNPANGEEYLYYPIGSFLSRNLQGGNEVGFIFRITPEDTDLFNPPTVPDIDPDWPNNSNNGGGEFDGIS